MSLSLVCSAFSRIAEYAADRSSRNTSDTTAATAASASATTDATAIDKQFMPICMAPCCHSICEWDECFYKPFFTTLGFTPADYAVLAAVSQWASLANKRNSSTISGDISTAAPGAAVGAAAARQAEIRSRGLILRPDILRTLDSIDIDIDIESLSYANGSSNTIVGVDATEEARLMSLCGEEFEESLSKDHKRQLGIVCKEFIDIGRAVGLLAAGYSEIELIRYTHSSAENLLICAAR
jgi:hypothetical protein